MPRFNKIDVYGITFKSLSALCKVLGYKTNMSQELINKRFGNIESMIKTRLNVYTDDQAKTKLLELINQKDQTTEMQNMQQDQRPYIDNSDPAVKCARAFVTAAINKALQDNQLLSSLMLAFNIDNTDRVLHTIDEIKKGV